MPLPERGPAPWPSPARKETKRPRNADPLSLPLDEVRCAIGPKPGCIIRSNPSGEAPMQRSCLLLLALLLTANRSFGQSGSTDSQTLQALLAEVRQLHHDLQTTTLAAQRAQILLYRLQAQQSVVRRMQERVDDPRS